MFKIVSKKMFSEKVACFEVEAPLIAQSRKAGHFVIVRLDEKGERIPLTIADADTEKGTITLVVQAVGASSTRINALNVGDELADVVGPLGHATDIQKYGTVICCGGGVGVAPLLPIVKAMHEAGNRVIVVLAARTKDLIILEDEMRVGVEQVIQREHVDKCVCIGPTIMMKFVALLTKKYEVPTIVSLNTIMVDGTGMCGACRVTVGGKTKFVCVDGPEFDAAEVNFDEMMSRMRAYRAEETEAMNKVLNG